MQTLAQEGNYGAALELYRDLRLRLNRELRAEPDPATSALYREIRQEAERRAQAPSSRPFRAPSPVVPGSSRMDGTADAPASASRATLGSGGGAVPLDSRFYVLRSTDEEFQAAIARRESIVLVKGARQMGKTSLLARGLQQARQAGARVVHTDFQMLDPAGLESADRSCRRLSGWIADQLDLDVPPEQVWRPHLGTSVNFARYLRREVLAQSPEPIVWGLDAAGRQ